MSYNDRYWIDKQNRAERAQEHTREMERLYHNAIQECIANTKLYAKSVQASATPKGDPKVDVWNMDTVSALYEATNTNTKAGQLGYICVLNFASYKNPGGMFIKGSMAQEECLCHDSFLYNVLREFENDYYNWNREHLNHALYLNRALYTPGVIFDAEGKTEHVEADVLTCAAPNFTTYAKYAKGTMLEKDRKNRLALEDRIIFIRNILTQHPEVRTLVFGAYGCGVFGQDPTETAQIFKERFKSFPADRIIYAVPKGMDEKNWRAFKEIFS